MSVVIFFHMISTSMTTMVAIGNEGNDVICYPIIWNVCMHRSASENAGIIIYTHAMWLMQPGDAGNDV